MQAVEIRQAQEYIARERLQAAAGIARAVFQYRTALAVSDAQLQAFEAGAFSPYALAGDEAEPRRTRLERGNQRRNVSRIVLAVAVERHDDGRTRRGDARAHRRRLTAGLGVPDLPQPRMLRHQAAQFFGGGVSRAVIDINDL